LIGFALHVGSEEDLAGRRRQVLPFSADRQWSSENPRRINAVTTSIIFMPATITSSAGRAPGANKGYLATKSIYMRL